MPKRSGRKSVAQTPAPKSDKIYGSKKNPQGSASSEKTAKSIKLSEKTEKVLKEKLSEFKQEHPNKKSVTLSDLKAVYRRGSGAYSKSHRPTITGGAPNSRAAWSYARVNKFLKKAGGEKVKAAYVQDDDLMAEGGLIASNGQKSNLTLEQYRLVRTPEFKAWFGDWENNPENASKVVDENGEPLVVYHGAEIFNKEEKGLFYIFRPGSYFTDTYKSAEYYASKLAYGITDVKKEDTEIYSVFLNIKNPKTFDYSIDEAEDYFHDFDQYDKRIETYLSEGYDGLFWEYTFKMYDTSIKNKEKHFITFKPNQVKLADGINTTFDIDNQDIRYEKGGKLFNDKELLAKWKRGESIGFTGEAHLKAKGFIPRADGTKRKSEKYSAGGRIFPSRLGIPIVRGGWTKEKILRYLKSKSSDTITTYTLAKFISELDSWQELKDRLYYHGTTNYIPKGLKPSIVFSEKWAAQQGGGGYGDRYWGISLTKRKRTAESFSGISRSVNVYPVFLKTDAKIIERPDLQDASEIEDIIVELYEKEIDAVYIGGGEEELVVVNPESIMLYKDGSEHFDVYGGLKTKQLTDEQIKEIYDRAKLDWENYYKEYNKLETRKEFLNSIKPIKFDEGGELGEEVTCVNCGWKWNTSDSDKEDMYLCHQCGFDNTLYYSDIMSKLKKPMSVSEISQKHGVTTEYIENQLNIGLKHELEHTDDEGVARIIALHHIGEKPNYYELVEKFKLEEGGQPSKFWHQADQYEISDFLKNEKMATEELLCSADTRIAKAIICRAKIDFAEQKEQKAHNLEEKNAWSAVKNIWEDCLKDIKTGVVYEYKDGGECGCMSYKDGGLAYGNSHDKGGMPLKVESTGQNIEIEGGEGVINKRSMQMSKKLDFQGKMLTPCQIVSKINEMGGGVKFKCQDVAEILAKDGNF
jgi:hypothetical protein